MGGNYNIRTKSIGASGGHQEIRSFLARTGGGYGKDRALTTCFAVVSEAGQWHVLLNARTTKGAQAAIDQWRQRTRGRIAVIVPASEINV